MDFTNLAVLVGSDQKVKKSGKTLVDPSFKFDRQTKDKPDGDPDDITPLAVYQESRGDGS